MSWGSHLSFLLVAITGRGWGWGLLSKTIFFKMSPLPILASGGGSWGCSEVGAPSRDAATKHFKNLYMFSPKCDSVLVDTGWSWEEMFVGAGGNDYLGLGRAPWAQHVTSPSINRVRTCMSIAQLEKQAISSDMGLSAHYRIGCARIFR